jgi:hypothetical protein
MPERVTCYRCCGNMGWYTAPDGDTYLSLDPGEDWPWTKCEACDGTGFVREEDGDAG